MKVLFVGLGSIGTRHLRNLHAEAQRRNIPLEAWALRSSARELPKETAALLKGQLLQLPAQEQWDAAFITNPTSLHYETLRRLHGKVRALFIEKPLFEHSAYALEDCLAPGQKAYVAAPMRWCGAMLALKRYLMQTRQQPFSVRVICSSYLPEWRPAVDYRTVYSAHREMGGGVSIDLIHEWDYLVDLFGTPQAVYNFKGTYSNLEIDSDDLSVYIARWPKMLGEVHLDYFGRTYRRGMELFFENGTLTADFGSGTLMLPDGSVEQYEEPANRRYEREMAYFLDYALDNGAAESLNPPAQALAVLRLAQGEM